MKNIPKSLLQNQNKEREVGLYRTPLGRWALGKIEFTSGSPLEVWVKGHWIDVVIEHDGKDYYAIPPVIRLHKGLRARLIGQYTD